MDRSHARSLATSCQLAGGENRSGGPERNRPPSRSIKGNVKRKILPLELKPGEFSAFSPLPHIMGALWFRAAGLISPGGEGFAFSVVIPISFSEPVVFREPLILAHQRDVRRRLLVLFPSPR